MDHNLPWTVGDKSIFSSNFEDILFIPIETGARTRLQRDIAWVVEDNRDANAAYIVQACNAYPALVSALTELTARFERLEQYYYDNGSVARARAALAQVHA